MRGEAFCVGTHEDVVLDEFAGREVMSWHVDESGRATFAIPPRHDPMSLNHFADYHCARCGMNFGSWPEVEAHWAESELDGEASP